MLEISEKIHRVGRIPEGNPGIFHKDKEWLATTDGVHTVPVEGKLAENIALALRVQEKVDEALIAGHRPGFLSTVRMLNCRKTISAVRDTVPLRALLSKEKLKPENISLESLEEASGVPELMKDIEDILHSERSPILGSKDDMQIASYLDEHLSDLPAIVHVFDIPQKYLNEMVSKLLNHSGSLSTEDCMTKLNRNHTFLVLGKGSDGKYICFQKQGPEIHDKFELCELDQVLDFAINPVAGGMYLSFVGPSANRLRESSQSQQIKKAA